MATRRQIMLMALLMLTLAGCDAQQNVPPSATATPNPDAVWSVLPLDRDHLNGAMGIAMTSMDSAWVVGSIPSLYATGSWAEHLQLVNEHWQIGDTQNFSEGMQAIAATGEDNIWAVGSELAHKDATGWHEMPLPVPNSYLRAVQLSADGQEGWASGETIPQIGGNACCPHIPLLLHYQNGAWQQVKVDGHGPITSVSVEGNEGWAVIGPTTDNVTGEEYPPTLLHYHQGQWQPLANTDCPAGILCHAIPDSVYTVGADEAWLAGDFGSDLIAHRPHFLLAHYKDGQWQDVSPTTLVGNLPGEQVNSSALATLSFSDPQHGLVVGQQCSPRLPPDCTMRPLAFSYANGQWQAQAIPSHKDELLSGALALSMSDPDHALAIDEFNYNIYAYGYGMQGDGTPTVLPPVVTAPPATPRLPYPTNTPGVDCTTLLKAAFVNLRKLHSYHIALDEGSNKHLEGDTATISNERYFREVGSGWQVGIGSGYLWLAPSEFENLLGDPYSPEPQFIGTEQQDGQTVSHCQIVYKDGGSRDYWVGDEASGGLMHKMMNRQNATTILTITYSRFNEYTSLEQLGPIATPTPFPTPPPQPTDSGG